MGATYTNLHPEAAAPLAQADAHNTGGDQQNESSVMNVNETEQRETEQENVGMPAEQPTRENKGEEIEL